MLQFRLNGHEVALEGVDPNTTLLHWLRGRGLTGTKEGCAEGECGACAVVMVRRDLDGRARYEPVNACLFLIASAADQEILTVEGVSEGALHPVQEAMVRLGGSQCGYCTPGFVMSLFSEFYRPGRDGDFDEESIAGNLCRCTGYRPIRDAGRSLPMVGEGDAHAARLSAPPPEARSMRYEAGSRRFFRPTTLEEALELRAQHPELAIVTGGTDLVVEINQRYRRFEGMLSLEAVAELHALDETDEGFSLGAAAPLSRVEAWGKGRIPLLDQLWPLFSSRLIRNRATLGGNLVTASPIGDSPPALLALGAEVELASVRGARVLPLESLFTGYRQTALAADELLVRVRVPKPLPSVGRFYKVSKRHHDDISTVAAGFTLDLGPDRKVRAARLAYGGVAATPARAHAAEAALVGRLFDATALAEAKEAARAAFTPMTDHRGSADYRLEMVGSLLEKFHAELGSHA